MVKDIEAVNSYEATKQSNNSAQADLVNCDYIEYAIFMSCPCLLRPNPPDQE